MLFFIFFLGPAAASNQENLKALGKEQVWGWGQGQPPKLQGPGSNLRGRGCRRLGEAPRAWGKRSLPPVETASLSGYMCFRAWLGDKSGRDRNRLHESAGQEMGGQMLTPNPRQHP